MARYPNEDGNWFSELNETIWLDVTDVTEPDDESGRFWIKFGRVREDAISYDDLVDLREYLTGQIEQHQRDRSAGGA